MTMRRQRLAYAYAKAFVAVYGDHIQQDTVLKIYQAQLWLRAHEAVVNLLSFLKEDVTIVEKFIAKLLLPSQFEKLITLLLQDGRGALFVVVLHYISVLWQRKNNCLALRVQSFTQLTTLQRKKIKSFLQKSLGAWTMVLTYEQNKELIAGIRVQGEWLCWEHSVQRHLQLLQQTVASIGEDGYKKY